LRYFRRENFIREKYIWWYKRDILKLNYEPFAKNKNNDRVEWKHRDHLTKCPHMETYKK
jgi:hypothetical protein